MNIRRALIGMLSAVVAAALLLGVTFLDVNLTSDVEPDLSYRTLDFDCIDFRLCFCLVFPKRALAYIGPFLCESY